MYLRFRLGVAMGDASNGDSLIRTSLSQLVRGDVFLLLRPEEGGRACLEDGSGEKPSELGSLGREVGGVLGG